VYIMFFLMFCWPASLYNLVNKPAWCKFFLNIFISFLYMFRATMCPSSGEITVSMRHLVLVTLYGWLSGMQDGIHSTQSDKYQASRTYSYFSWWWAHSRPKHVEKRNRHTKKKGGLYYMHVRYIYIYVCVCVCARACARIYIYIFAFVVTFVVRPASWSRRRLCSFAILRPQYLVYAPPVLTVKNFTFFTPRVLLWFLMNLKTSHDYFPVLLHQLAGFYDPDGVCTAWLELTVFDVKC